MKIVNVNHFHIFFLFKIHDKLFQSYLSVGENKKKISHGNFPKHFFPYRFYK